MADLLDAAASAWTDSLPPTHSAAVARIGRIRPAAYARTRNHLDGAVTGLSPYLTHGLITLREVLAGVQQRESLSVQHMRAVLGISASQLGSIAGPCR